MRVTNRISRFHDEKGNRVDVRGMMYAPLAFATAVLRVVFGYRPRQPTISYRARTVIDGLLDSNSRVAEFGSGMSTPWLAGRCGFLLSLENDEEWHRKVSAMIATGDFGHVQYELRTPDSFSDLSGFPDGSFDFILIDGWDRHGCVVNALPKLRSGGWVYLDNSDKDMTRPDGDLRRAEEALLEAVRESEGTIRYFVDFSPTNFFVEQGLLVGI
ncbi:MAG: hypothetical protein HOK25_15815 [Rhodospirillaceae bacterium]|nr:hypothetical protein [Rhodospirillaceae bacterium]MBT5515529.1 hypothetical protein [Rhodospirillaceae bacterium]